MHHTIRLDRRRLLAGLVLAFAARPTCAQPPDANTLFNDGVNLLFAGKPKESAEAFDALVKLRPQIEPELWQRGLALYYADRFADGVAQFERHKEVNPADVENVTWTSPVWRATKMSTRRGSNSSRSVTMPAYR